MLPADVAERHKAEAEQVFRLIGGTQAQIEKFALRRAMDMRCFPCAFQDMVKTVPAGAAVISYFQQKERVLIFVLGPEGLKGPAGRGSRFQPGYRRGIGAVGSHQCDSRHVRQLGQNSA